MKGISKLRSNNYPLVIEVNVPCRFYWDENGYDGFEFGSLEQCTKYQLGLLNLIIKMFEYQSSAMAFMSYMRKHHSEELKDLLEMIDAEESGIPKSFIDAFKEDN
jgi:hypothetical protein